MQSDPERVSALFRGGQNVPECLAHQRHFVAQLDISADLSKSFFQSLKKIFISSCEMILRASLS
jgi:hypothetical protein